jgi:undecaprenyl diphosphate synthase
MSAVSKLKIPEHIAIVMDGNGRWASKRRLPKLAGHKKGANVANDIVAACQKLGVKYLTLYAFSTENWKRSESEVNDLMDLFRSYLAKDINELTKKDVSIKFIGNKLLLPSDIQLMITDVETSSKNHNFKLVLAISYGSREEIRSAAFKLAKDAINQKVDLEKAQPEIFDQYLYTAGIPDPDLFIRTSGEYRISNFLLWQIAYAELYFTKILWPDFNEAELKKAIEDFSTRERRYGL